MNILAIGGAPGWPAAWPATSSPRPFTPPTFAITIDILRVALAAKAGTEAACLRGDPSAIAGLLVEIIKLIHADPFERNMYLNPSRSDQVLVYVPERWEVYTLRDAIRLVLEYVVDELAEAVPYADDRLKNIATQTRAKFLTHAKEVVQSSRAPLEAHLESMGRQLRSPSENWLGEVAAGCACRPRMFGQERRGHLDPAGVVAALEGALKVYSADDYARQSEAEMASGAITRLAQMLLVGHPENLTVKLVGEGRASVRTPLGWEMQDAARAAEKQASVLCDLAAAYIRGEKSPLRPLAEYMCANAQKIASDEAGRLELIKQYSAAAEHYAGLAA